MSTAWATFFATGEPVSDLMLVEVDFRAGMIVDARSGRVGGVLRLGCARDVSVCTALHMKAAMTRVSIPNIALGWSGHHLSR